MAHFSSSPPPLPSPRDPTPADAPRLDTHPTPLSTGPVPESRRLESLDVLRGFALLGILVMNIQAFAMPFAAYMNPTAYGDLTGANYLVWLLSHVLADQKFMSIFSMLFGAGIVLMADRRRAEALPAAGLHYRRMGWLLVFGLAHGYLLWYGDILYAYAMCGMLVFLLRNVQPGVLIALAFGFLAMGSLLWIGPGLALQHLASPQEVAAFEADFGPHAVEREVAAYQSGWLEQMDHRALFTFQAQTFMFLLWSLWRVTGMMLLGMALYKVGVLTGRAPVWLYAYLIALAALVGIPVMAYGVGQRAAAGWDAVYSMFLGSQFNYWASILVAMGHIAAIVLVHRAGLLRWLTGALAAVGRTALTNYLLQSILCTLIFYGHGLGLFGQVERTGQIAIVLAVWIVQLTASPIWLRHFHFGPAEWLWRSLTYSAPQPMRRHRELPAPPPST